MGTTTELSTVTKEEILADKLRWKNRRMMAWCALTSMILITLGLLFTDFCSEDRLKIVGELITWYYFVMTSIIGAYMGFTTLASIKSMKG